jgi:hypothetical protein
MMRHLSFPAAMPAKVRSFAGSAALSLCPRSKLVALASLAAVLALAPPSRAGMITFVTPPGATNPTDGQPVNARADITTSAGSITITLTNLLANPTAISQCISDFSFTVGNGGSLTGSSQTGANAQEITINSGGSFTLGATLTTVAAVGWPYSSTATVGTLNVLAGAGAAGPAHLIIGPPGPGGTYSNANGSIAGNGPHNPALDLTSTFTITGAGITADTTITAAVFSFGTTAGVDVPGVPTSAVPEPSTALGAVTAVLFGLAFGRRRRLAAA